MQIPDDAGAGGGVRGGRDHALTLPDGRRLGYAIFGDPGGFPVIYSHGFPGSRLEAGLMEDAAQAAGVALIAPDRPGLGLSDFRSGRRIPDWAGDVVCLADALGLGRLSLLGGSGGCPYALAGTRLLGDRLVRVGLVAGLAPPEKDEVVRRMSLTARLAFTLARRSPRLFRLAFGGLGTVVAQFPGLMFLLHDTTSPDRTVLAERRVRTILDLSLREAFRGGIDGPLLELRLIGAPWEFDLAAVTADVAVWHGLDDGVVPPAMARQLAEGLPRSELHLIPGEGHLSLSSRHGVEILQDLLPRQG